MAWQAAGLRAQGARGVVHRKRAAANAGRLGCCLLRAGSAGMEAPPEGGWHTVSRKRRRADEAAEDAATLGEAALPTPAPAVPAGRAGGRRGRQAVATDVEVLEPEVQPEVNDLAGGKGGGCALQPGFAQPPVRPPCLPRPCWACCRHRLAPVVHSCRQQQQCTAAWVPPGGGEGCLIPPETNCCLVPP